MDQFERLGGEAWWEAKREQKVSLRVQNDAAKGPKGSKITAKSDHKLGLGPFGAIWPSNGLQELKKVASGSPGGAKMEPKWSPKLTKKQVKDRCGNNDDFVPFWTAF